MQFLPRSLIIGLRSQLTAGLVDFLGRAHFVAMAAHWTLAVPVSLRCGPSLSYFNDTNGA